MPIESGTPALTVPLDYVKKHLNMSGVVSVDDAELQTVIDAAVGLLEDLIGPIYPQTVTETHDGGGTSIVLRQQPVLSVTSVTERAGNLVYTDTSDLSAFGYQVDGPLLTRQSSGYLGRWLPGHRNVSVTYLAGRSFLSPKLQLAIAELVRHLWATQQGSRGRGQQAEDWSPQMAFAIPNRVRELLGSELLAPSIG